MSKPNTEENRQKLARQIVEDWSLDDLMEEMMTRLEDDFKHNDELFQETWCELHEEDCPDE